MDKKEKKSIWKELSTYFIIFVFVVLIRTFIITPIRVNGASMEATLFDKEIMFLDKISYKVSKIKRFDIIVLKYHNNILDKDEYLIKRVIGLPNETLKYENDKLYINDELVEENFNKDTTENFNITSLGFEKIPDNCYIVLGDNRNDSTDSRIFGCVEKENILGKANLVIYPFNHFGIKK